MSTNGHGGAVHGLVAHSSLVFSCCADGHVRGWEPGGSHACAREVSLGCGPLYALVPMGRQLWVAGHDGTVHALDGVSLEAPAPPRRVHAGLVTRLCPLQARTTRPVWSFSTSDGKLCRWKVDELGPQHTAERAGLLQAEVAGLASQLHDEQAARTAEQQAAAAAAARAAEEIAASDAALDEARQSQHELLAVY